MNQTLRLWLLSIAIMCAGAIVTACDEQPVAPLEEVGVSPVAPSLPVAASVRLESVVGSAGAKWSSSNSSVATVDSSGLVTGVGVGSATVKFESATSTGQTVVTVYQGGGTLRAGFLTTCGVASTGGILYCWGRNDRGQVGIGSGVSPQMSPVRVNGGLAFTAVSPGADAVCGMTSQGPYCWGRYAANVIGDGTVPADPFSPTRVRGGEVFTAVESNGAYLENACSGDLSCSSSTCGLTAAGLALCWGATWWDPRALIIPSTSSAPPLKSVSVGMSHTCGIGTDTKAYCWGSNRWNQLGFAGVTPVGTNTAVPVGGELRFQAISAGRAHTCAIDLGGDAYCWGANSKGQLGAPSNEVCQQRFFSVTCRSTPAKVAGNYKFVAISASSATPEISDSQPLAHSCGVTTSQEIVCWGYNAFGQLGNGTVEDSLTPVKVSGGLKFRSVTTGFGYTCAITVAGSGYCWGSNAFGQLGNGSIADANVPVLIGGGLSFR